MVCCGTFWAVRASAVIPLVGQIPVYCTAFHSLPGPSPHRRGSRSPKGEIYSSNLKPMKVIMRPTSHPGLLTSGNAHYGLIQMVVCAGKIFYILEVIYNFFIWRVPVLLFYSDWTPDPRHMAVWFVMLQTVHSFFFYNGKKVNMMDRKQHPYWMNFKNVSPSPKQVSSCSTEFAVVVTPVLL